MARHLSISDYTYDLPVERIAYAPLENREDSKLLVYSSGKLEESRYAHIASYLPKSSLILFNDTKVVEARILFQKESGSKIEVFCLEPAEEYPDIVTGMSQKGSVRWNCLVGGASKWKNGIVLRKTSTHNGNTFTLEASIREKKKDCFEIEFNWQPKEVSFAEILHRMGVMPLPPYIKREAELKDAERYQTIYAKEEGSVAAPTAGLHFSEVVMNSLAANNIRRAYLTLHVGAGTFKPVSAATMQDHEMHAEFMEINTDLLELLLKYPTELISATGTTTLRTLESLYWLGVKTAIQKNLEEKDLKILQWDAYELPNNISRENALLSLQQWMQEKGINRLLTTTQLLIAPGYKVRMVKRLVTNFHQPNSTLLLLVAACIGDAWKSIYNHALANDFRFLSYGDGCLLEIDE